jgi:hypothetical protein
MRKSVAVRLSVFAFTAALLPAWVQAQSFNGSIAGRVMDPSGAVVSGADLVLKNVSAGVEMKRKSNDAGEYAFRNLLPGTYELRATSAGFSPFLQRSVEVTMNADVRVDVTLPLAGTFEQVEVVGQSVLTYDTGAHVEGIAPGTLQQLPLLVAGRMRSSAGFAILVPGVSTGGRADAFDARINGGMQTGDEAVLDGASMQQGFMSQSGMISISQDFPFSPDMVSEVKVMTSSYEPQYGSSTSGQIMATTKSGSDQFHGALFEYHRTDKLNATQFGSKKKALDKENNYGAALGGPIKVPGLWSSSVKSYFYADVERFRIKGGVNQPTLSIPSARERGGDFSDWRDAAGNLIPIYDPATTRVVNGVVVRDPFPDNIIPANRITPQARQFFSFLPTPTSGGPLNNYLVPTPVPDTIVGDSDHYFLRLDTYVGQKDHLSVSLWHQRAPAKFFSTLPHEIANETFSDPQNSWVNRANWDHTFGPNLLNHMTFGYLNRNEGYGSVNTDAVNSVPQIAGVVSHNAPPRIDFSDGFASFGEIAGVNANNVTTRPTYVLNDLVTFIRGSHLIKAGFEYRNIGGNIHTNTNEAGTFAFSRGATGVLGQNSGSPIASFLLGAVDNANVDFRTLSAWYPRQAAYIVHVGDTWKASNKVTLNYGLRWDLFTPSKEKFNRFSFFDPEGANPGAGGRAGRLAFAGDEFGAASYGKDYPEKLYWKAFQPRLGLTYALNPKTIVRAGWGIFYGKHYVPGWGGGLSQDGFNSNVAFNSTLGGLQPAFFLQNGFPQNFTRPPFIRSDYRNGQNVLYRPLDGNERPRSQQWNITVDREIAKDFMVSVAYVGSRGTHLPSVNAPLNALDPRFLSLGSQLYDEFQPGQTSLHGVPIPYAGWREQMTGCAPSLAQALLPFPQYCSNLQGLSENEGTSTYNSLQTKLEKRFSSGTYLLVSYTLARLTNTGAENPQISQQAGWSGVSGVISPFEKGRNKSLAADDVTHTLSAAMVYELPFGKNRKWLNSGVAANVIGGWQVSTLFRYTSGIPFFFRSSFCNVPSQFRAGCIPALKSGATPFLQDKGSFDPAKGPLFDKNAFEPVSAFNFYWGTGDRVSDVRGFGYHNQDISLIKNTSLGGRVNLQLRIEAFNVWNWHIFSANGDAHSGWSAFNTDLASPDFGKWNGTVSNPRNVQAAVRLEF